MMQYPAYVYDYEGNEVYVAKTTLNYHQYGVVPPFPCGCAGILSKWLHVPTDEEWTAMTLAWVLSFLQAT